MSESFEADLDSRGRILIPEYFRKRLGLKGGDTVSVEIKKREEEV